MNDFVRHDYDAEIEKILAEPEKTLFRWGCPYNEDNAGCFQHTARMKKGEESLYKYTPTGLKIGCLSQIRNDTYYHACTPELTERIRNDERIPKEIDRSITREQLLVMKEYQVEIDGMYERGELALL